jgi:hypothetical protein
MFFKLKSKAAIDTARESVLADKHTSEARIADLLSSRRDVQLNGSVDDLVSLDADIARERIAVERAKTRLAELDTRTADHNDEQQRRQAAYKTAVAAKYPTAAKTALDEYARHAALAAAALNRFGAIKVKVAEANALLPDGAEPISDGELFNGASARRLGDGFTAPGWAHSSILDRAVLPALDRGKFHFGEHNIEKLGFGR